MTLDSLIFWLFVLAWIVVLVLIVFRGLVPAGRQGLRIVRRILALGSESPLPLALAKAEGDADRMNRALDALPRLAQRAVIAVESIRSTTIVPPALGELTARLRREAQAFRREFPR
jgi:hypothetical protein